MIASKVLFRERPHWENKMRFIDIAICRSITTEAAVRSCSVKMSFLKNSQNSQ